MYNLYISYLPDLRLYPDVERPAFSKYNSSFSQPFLKFVSLLNFCQKKNKIKNIILLIHTVYVSSESQNI